MRFIRITGSILLVALAGCGSGGGISDAITPLTESRYTDDAKVLAVRLAGDSPWISATLAGAFDADMSRIRSAYPAVKDIHTFPGFVLNELIFDVNLNAPWIDRWRNGTVMTGDRRIDALLQTYNAVSVRSLGPFSVGEGFLVTLGQSLNIPAILIPFRESSSQFTSVTENGLGTGGSPDDIFFDSASHPRRYAFFKGIGDVSGHTWEFTLQNDGTITLKEYDGFPPFGRSARNLPQARLHRSESPSPNP